MKTDQDIPAGKTVYFEAGKAFIYEPNVRN
jgi:hypothetical protein